MDDILLVYAKAPWWDHERFVRDFTASTCYHAPLKLEDGKEGTFLETQFEIRDGSFRHWLKNENDGGAPRVWRYQHFHSHAPYLQKRALVTACLRKVHKMASDTAALYRSAHLKLAEFRRLQYPTNLLRKACTFIAASTGEGAWLGVRDAISD